MNILSLYLAATKTIAFAIGETTRTTSVYIQPITAHDAAPSLLAEIQYTFSENQEKKNYTAHVTAFEAPELQERVKLVRVGVYNTAAQAWASSTSVLSIANFEKGYAPHFVLNVEKRSSDVIAVACKGLRIDAGQTRDFGPRAVLAVAAQGKQPELNRPVLLSPEGEKIEPQQKSFFQKYWWAIAIVMFLLMSGRGGEEKK